MRRSARRAIRKARQGNKDCAQGEMMSGGDSSSEETQSGDDALATGMMYLAIACTHVEWQSEKEAKGGGKSASLTPVIFSVQGLGILVVIECGVSYDRLAVCARYVFIFCCTTAPSKWL